MLKSKEYSLKAVLSNISWLIFDKIFILAMNMVVIFVIANYYGPEKYGLYQYATNIVLILEVIVQLVDARVVKKRYTEDNYDEIVFNVTLSKVFLSLLALLFGIVIMVFTDRGESFVFMLFVLLLDSILKNLRFGMENRFEYILQSKRIVLAANFGLMVGTGLQLLAVLRKAPIEHIAIIQMCATTVSYVTLLIQYKRAFHSFSFRKTFNKTLVKSIVRESFPLAIASAAATIYTRCDSVMLGMLLTTKEVGIYAISSKLISTIQLLVVPIQTTVFVKMLEWKDNRERYERNYIRITSLATWISIVGVLLSFIVLPFIFQLLKPDYLPALETYKILSIGSVFGYNAVLRSSHFTLIGKGQILMQTQLITVIVNVILNYSLIKMMGMNGAAAATVIAQILSLFISNLFYKDARFVFKAQVKAFNPWYIFKK